MKRFTETTKWSDPWYQDLPPNFKLLWLYICDCCDSSGVWKVNSRLASFQLGSEFESERVLEQFGKRIHVLSSEKWFLPSFIKFQYGELSEECRPHRPILELIKRHDLERVLEGYRSPIGRAKEKDKTRKGQGSVSVDGEFERKARATSLEIIKAYCLELTLPESDAIYLWEKWEQNGWKNGGDKIKDWKGVIRSHKAAGYLPSQKENHGQRAKSNSGKSHQQSAKPSAIPGDESIRPRILN